MNVEKKPGGVFLYNYIETVNDWQIALITSLRIIYKLQWQKILIRLLAMNHMNRVAAFVSCFLLSILSIDAAFTTLDQTNLQGKNTNFT